MASGWDKAFAGARILGAESSVVTLLVGLVEILGLTGPYLTGFLALEGREEVVLIEVLIVIPVCSFAECERPI